jgi:hypothetical protein
VIEVRGCQSSDDSRQPDTIYVTTGPEQAVPGEDLEEEFAAWDAASDEALLRFEAELS